VKVESGGYLRFVSLANILLNITSALVLLSLPQRFVLFFATTCLGQLSKIYKQVIYERFDLKTEVSGITTRLMTSSAAFVQLEDVDGTENGGAGISRKRMSERLREVLRNRSSTLDSYEVEQLVDYCFKAVTSTRKTRTAFQLLVEEVTGLFKKGREPEVVVSPCIDIDAFSVASTSNERISFATVVDWFDADRRLTWLEKLFTPYDVKGMSCGVRSSAIQLGQWSTWEAHKFHISRSLRWYARLSRRSPRFFVARWFSFAGREVWCVRQGC